MMCVSLLIFRSLKYEQAAQGEVVPMRRSGCDVKRAELCNWLPAGQLRYPEVQGVGNGGVGDVPAKDGFNVVDDDSCMVLSPRNEKADLDHAQKMDAPWPASGGTTGIRGGGATGGQLGS